MEYKKSFITFGVVLVSVIGSAVPVYAEDIVISVSDNGSGSTNEVTVTANTENTVTQNNTSEITNNVTNNSNTGDNTANNNSGDASIQTGDATTNTSIVNENVNTNVAQGSAAGPVGGSIVVSNNGSQSHNTTSVTAKNSISVSQNNTAHITNNAVTNANTGKNTANNNLGNVTIKTGSIEATTKIVNKDINNSVAKIVGGCGSSCVISNEMVLKIFGNGSGSVNNLVFNYDNDKTYTSNNVADIYNNTVHNLNTGGNSANGNNGDVTILSGDVKSSITITNEGINSSTVVIDCGCKPPKPEEPEEPNTPNNPNPNGGTGGGGSNGGGSSSGDVLGAAIGQVLPATGNLFMLWATIASLILFFSGWYLRFRSGCAPGLAR